MTAITLSRRLARTAALPRLSVPAQRQTMGRLGVLFVIAFVDTVGAALVVPILPFYATRYGASAFEVGLLIASFSVAQLLSAPTWGRASDRFGRRPVLLAGLAVSAAAYVAFAFAASVPLLLVTRLLQGLGGGTIGVVQAYVADASSTEQRTKALGWLTAVTSFGWLSGAALGSMLVSVGGERAPGLFTAGLTLIVALVAALLLRESRGMRRSGSTTAPAIPRTGRAAARAVVVRWREPAARLIWIYTLGIGAFYGTAAVLPLLLQERLGTSEHTIGYIVMYLAGLGVVVRAGFLGWLVDRLGEVRLARFGIMLLAVGLILAWAGRGAPVLFVSFTVMPFGTAFLFPSVTGLLSKVVASHERGLFLGLQQSFGGVARVVFPLGAGALIDQAGRGVPFLVSGLLVLLSLPLLRGAAAASEPGA